MTTAATDTDGYFATNGPLEEAAAWASMPSIAAMY